MRCPGMGQTPLASLASPAFTALNRSPMVLVFSPRGNGVKNAIIINWPGLAENEIPARAGDTRRPAFGRITEIVVGGLKSH